MFAVSWMTKFHDVTQEESETDEPRAAPRVGQVAAVEADAKTVVDPGGRPIEAWSAGEARAGVEMHLRPPGEPLPKYGLAREPDTMHIDLLAGTKPAPTHARTARRCRRRRFASAGSAAARSASPKATPGRSAVAARPERPAATRGSRHARCSAGRVHATHSTVTSARSPATKKRFALPSEMNEMKKPRSALTEPPSTSSSDREGCVATTRDPSPRRPDRPVLYRFGGRASFSSRGRLASRPICCCSSSRPRRRAL